MIWIPSHSVCSVLVSGEGGYVSHRPRASASLEEVALCFASLMEGVVGGSGSDLVGKIWNIQETSDFFFFLA